MNFKLNFILYWLQRMCDTPVKQSKMGVIILRETCLRITLGVLILDNNSKARVFWPSTATHDKTQDVFVFALG